MTLRTLPEIQAGRLPEVCAFHHDEEALERWNPGIVAQQTPENTITVLDVIGADPLSGGGVTAKRVAAALREIGNTEVFVDINSPGGDFFEGVAIYNALRAHPAKVTVRVLGVAASAASVIAMAADVMQIGKASFLMVHNAWVLAVGNRHDLADAVKMLEPFDAAMASVYSDRAGVDLAKAAGWMDSETWFNGTEAIEAGLADGLLPADVTTEDAAKACAGAEMKPLRIVDAALAKAGHSRSQRRSLIAAVKGGKQDAAPTVMQDADVERLRALTEGIFKP